MHTLRLAERSAIIAQSSNDPAVIAAASRNIEIALRLNGLMSGTSQSGAQAIVVTIGPDAEASVMPIDGLGTERPTDAGLLA